MFVIWNENAKAYVGFKNMRSLLVSDRNKAFRFPSLDQAKRACGIAERPMSLFI